MSPEGCPRSVPQGNARIYLCEEGLSMAHAVGRVAEQVRRTLGDTVWEHAQALCRWQGSCGWQRGPALGTSLAEAWQRSMSIWDDHHPACLSLSASTSLPAGEVRGEESTLYFLSPQEWGERGLVWALFPPAFSTFEIKCHSWCCSVVVLGWGISQWGLWRVVQEPGVIQGEEMEYACTRSVPACAESSMG